MRGSNAFSPSLIRSAVRAGARGAVLAERCAGRCARSDVCGAMCAVRGAERCVRSGAHGAVIR